MGRSRQCQGTRRDQHKVSGVASLKPCRDGSRQDPPSPPAERAEGPLRMRFETQVVKWFWNRAWPATTCTIDACEGIRRDSRRVSALACQQLLVESKVAIFGMADRDDSWGHLHSGAVSPPRKHGAWHIPRISSEKRRRKASGHGSSDEAGRQGNLEREGRSRQPAGV